MSFQPMVVGARGCTVDEFVGAFPMIGQGCIEISSGWRWFVHPGVCLTPDVAEAALRGLPGLGLLVVAEEDGRWTIRLLPPGQEPFELTHAFGLLRPLDDDPLGGVPDDGYEDDWDLLRRQERSDPFVSDELLSQMRDLTRLLPPELARQFATDDPERFRRSVLEHQASLLLEAVERLGIPHDAKAVRAALLGESVSPRELGTPLGNAFRLLSALGFGGALNSYLGDFSDTEAAPVSAEEDRLTWEPGALSELLAVPVEPLVEGPLELPVRRFHHVIRAGLWCDEEAVARIALLYPPGSAAPELPSQYAARHYRRGNREQLDYDHPAVIVSLAGRSLRKSIAEIPEGTVLDVVVAPTLWEDVRPTRWRGPVIGQIWQIREASTIVPVQRWREFVELLDRIFTDAPIPCTDPRELEVLADRLEDLASLPDSPIRVTSQGISAQPFLRDEVIAHLFRLRFGDLWDTGPAAADEAWLSRAEADPFGLEGAEDSEGRLVYAPRAECIHEGDYCEVYRASLDGLTGPELARLREEQDAWLRAGMDYLGEVVVSVTPACYCLCFLSADRTAFGVALVDAMGTLSRWLIVCSPNGAYLSCPLRADGDIEEGLRSLREMQADEAVVLDPTLKSVAQALDWLVGESLENSR